MKYLVNSREMKLYDQNTSQHYKVPALLLMEQAAIMACQEIFSVLEENESVMIVCGNGNNGADGLAIGRMLMLSGYPVTICYAGDKKKATEQNRKQLEILNAYEIEIINEIPTDAKYDVMIDALFGVGLSRNIDGTNYDIIQKCNEMKAKKIAIDIPSGVAADNGAILGIAFKAHMTITFSFGKTGMYLWPGNEYTGNIIIKQIGINEKSFLDRKPELAALEETDISRLPARTSHSNKGTYGKLLIVAGSTNMAGAAILCAKSAYASGCGLVRVYTAEENRTALQTSIPEAILTTYNEKKLDRGELLEAMKWADVIVCGPGIGRGDTAETIVKNVIRNASVPVLFDADALNIIAEDVSMLLKPHTEMVVTPHLGEMSRLGSVTVSYIQNRLLETAQEFSRQYNVICVLKDERTITSVPYGQSYLNLTGNHGMATAGSGDVLSGVIGGLMAQGMPAEDAAPFGTFLHGMAGDFMVSKMGYRGMMASDLISGLKAVMAKNGD